MLFPFQCLFQNPPLQPLLAFGFILFHFESTYCDLLVGLFHVGPIRTLSTVVGLNSEGVLLLQLTVQLVFGPDHPLSSGLVQDHCLEGDVLPMDPEAAYLT